MTAQKKALTVKESLSALQLYLKSCDGKINSWAVAELEKKVEARQGDYATCDLSFQIL